MLVPEDEIEYAQAPPPPAPKLSGPEIASEEQQLDKYDDKGNQNFWLSPPWSGPGEAPPEVTATETYLTPDQKKNLADLLANDPSALQWCPLCVGQDVPPLPPPPFTCPQCPSGQICPSCDAGTAVTSNTTVYLNIGSCPSCNGPTKKDQQEQHDHTGTEQTHDDNDAEKTSGKTGTNVTVHVKHNRINGTVLITNGTYGPGGKVPTRHKHQHKHHKIIPGTRTSSSTTTTSTSTTETSTARTTSSSTTSTSTTTSDEHVTCPPMDEQQAALAAYQMGLQAFWTREPAAWMQSPPWSFNSNYSYMMMSPPMESNTMGQSPPMSDDEPSGTEMMGQSPPMSDEPSGTEQMGQSPPMSDEPSGTEQMGQSPPMSDDEPSGTEQMGQSPPMSDDEPSGTEMMGQSPPMSDEWAGLGQPPMASDMMGQSPPMSDEPSGMWGTRGGHQGHSSTDFFLSNDDESALACYAKENPTAVRWCQLCSGQAPPPVPDLNLQSCPACPTGQVCGDCSAGPEDPSSDATMFLYVGMHCLQCPGGDTKDNVRQNHKQDIIVHGDNIQKDVTHGKTVDGNVTTRTKHRRRPGSPTESTDTTTTTYDPLAPPAPIGTKKHMKKHHHNPRTLNATRPTTTTTTTTTSSSSTSSSTTSTDTSTVLVPSPPPTFQTLPGKGGKTVVRINPDVVLPPGTTPGPGGVIFIPANDVAPPGAKHVKAPPAPAVQVIDGPDGPIYVLPALESPPPGRGAKPPHEQQPYANGESPPFEQPLIKGNTPAYQQPQPGQSPKMVPVIRVPSTATPPMPPVRYHLAPGPNNGPPIREIITPLQPVGPKPSTPYWSTTTTSTEVQTDAGGLAPAPPLPALWCPICLDKPAPELPTGTTVLCPPCPVGQVCGACPVGSVAEATARRSLLGLPSWLGGKSGSDDVANYVVGVTSTLPRNVGGPTVYLSATPCTLCGDGSN